MFVKSELRSEAQSEIKCEVLIEVLSDIQTEVQTEDQTVVQAEVQTDFLCPRIVSNTTIFKKWNTVSKRVLIGPNMSQHVLTCQNMA